jgi:valyl-tRNA synthetase
VEYAEEAGSLYVFRYPVAGGRGEALPVATTRPETILGDTAVAVHPQDPRYAALVGRECEVPLSGGRCASNPGVGTHACLRDPGSRCALRAAPQGTR